MLDSTAPSVINPKGNTSPLSSRISRTNVSWSRHLPIFLLLCFALTRIYHVLALPLFLDEASHLTRAQWVWENRPLYLLETGKALAPYLASAFWPFVGAPFLGRIVVVLIGLVGLAAAYAVGRDLHSPRVGYLTMLLCICAPELFFFERMALVDTTMSAMAMLTIWFAIRMMRDPRWMWAVLCGVGLMLTVLAKLTGLTYLSIPVLAIFIGRGAWPLRIRQAVIALVTFAILAAPMALYLVSIDADPTGQSSGLTSTDTSSLSVRIIRNVPAIIEAERRYWGDFMVIVMGVALLVSTARYPLRSGLLIAQIVLPVGVIAATAQALWLRYLSPAAPFLLLLTALGLVNLGQGLAHLLKRPRLWVVLPAAVSIVWIMMVSIPFILTAYRDPAALPLPAGDRTEYIEWIPGGYGLREAAAYLNANITTPITMIGVAVNCNTARLYLRPDSPVHLVCPDLDWGGGNPLVVSDLKLHVERDGVVWMLTEDKNPPTVDVRLFDGRVEVAKFARPSGRNTVRIYRIERTNLPAQED